MRWLLGLPARRVEGFQADCKRQGYKVAQRNVASVASVWQLGRNKGDGAQGRDFGIMRVWCWHRVRRS